MAFMINQLKIFSFPKNLTTDFDGFAFLGSINISTWNFTESVVILDFTGNEFFDPNLCSPLGCLIDDLSLRKNSVLFSGINDETEKLFKRNGFYGYVSTNYQKRQQVFQETDFKIDYRKFALADIGAFQVYIYESVFMHDDFPKMSPALKKEINRSILEIFNNAHTHGKCDYIHTCGYYSRRDKVLNFTMSDMGVTIRKNVNNYFKRGNKISGISAISWAVEQGNTTKKVEDNIPGGLGFSLIRDFLKLNKGSLQIVSSDGYWQEADIKITERAMETRILGTIVNLRFNLNDSNLYILAKELESTLTQ